VHSVDKLAGTGRDGKRAAADQPHPFTSQELAKDPDNLGRSTVPNLGSSLSLSRNCNVNDENENDQK
jgi:hypothetical protein